MLKTLQIKDYALIENITVSFHSGLNIITGETGAGKSILIDALGLLLGERASTEVVRRGTQKAVVEGVFDVSGNKKMKALLKELDIEFQDELIIRREISLKGSGRSFLNDTPAPLTALKDAGFLLVDLHGQHEHQSLLRKETHIEMLDEAAGLEKLRDGYESEYRKLRALISEYTELMNKEELLHQKKDLYEFQVREITAVNPQPGEDEKLADELKVLENTERLAGSATMIYDLLNDGEVPAFDILNKARTELHQIAQIDKSLQGLDEMLSNVIVQAKEISSELRTYKEHLELDPERLEEMRQRLNLISLLKKKYGGSVDAVLKYCDEISRELELATGFEEETAKLKANIEAQRKICGEQAVKLSEERRKAGSKISKSIIGELVNLGIVNAQFVIRQEQPAAQGDDYIYAGEKKVRYGSSGIDDVEFLMSANAGEEVKPLAKVASGGEVSRIMLSLKTILAKNDRLPLLIFDEIDTGVSGRIAQKVGNALKNLSSYHQIIAITHLPQIAGLSDHHYSVEKREEDGRAFSHIRELTLDEKVVEVAKLMSGELVTEASLKGARELMGIQ